MGVKIQTQKKTGKIYVVVHHNRQRVRKYCGIGEEGQKIAEEASKKIAASMVFQAETCIDQLTYKSSKEKVITFKAYAEKQIKVIEHTRGLHTVYDYNLQLKNHINPELGHFPLNEITRPIAKDFIMSKLSKKKISAKKGDDTPLSKASVKHIFNTVRMFFNCAIDDQIVQVNPFHNMGKLIGKVRNHEDINFLTPQETVVCLSSIKEHFPYYYQVFFTAIRTGLRIGELLTLKWEDIDFVNRSINVCKTTQRDGTVKDSPKSGKKRRVDMSRDLTELLVAYKNEQESDQTTFEQPKTEPGSLYVIHR
ncbi:MAG: tyrosine-type recombinase/integrase [Nitrospirae bacterium]|nr:tyrosine-type recombinase/integrase [Nitrospirota bacterium]